MQTGTAHDPLLAKQHWLDVNCNGQVLTVERRAGAPHLIIKATLELNARNLT